MNIRLKRTPGIYVVGFMGAGKSTVGRRLAQRLGWSFIDTDQEIEAAEHTTIPEIFSSRGEAGFRRIESQILLRQVCRIEAGHPAVLALGGGAYTVAGNRDLLANNGVTVWLDCPFAIVQRRVAQATHRPLARDPEAFAALYESRRALYALADIHATVESDDPEIAVAAILAHPLMK